MKGVLVVVSEWVIEDIIVIVLSQIFHSEFVHSIAQGMKGCLPVLRGDIFTVRMGGLQLHLTQAFILGIQKRIELWIARKVGRKLFNLSMVWLDAQSLQGVQGDYSFVVFGRKKGTKKVLPGTRNYISNFT